MAFQPLGEYYKENMENERYHQRRQKESGYYCIIPHYVLADKKLPHIAKLIFCEVNALANKYGYCFATNNHFAELLGCSEVYIKKSIQVLRKSGYIKIDVSKRKADGTRRKIWICPIPHKTFGEVEK